MKKRPQSKSDKPSVPRKKKVPVASPAAPVEDLRKTNPAAYNAKLNEAAEAVRQGLSTRAAALQFGVKRTTLQDRIKLIKNKEYTCLDGLICDDSVVSDNEALPYFDRPYKKPANPRALVPPHVESVLVRYVKQRALAGNRATTYEISEIVTDYLKMINQDNEMGKNWVYRFIDRNSLKLDIAAPNEKNQSEALKETFSDTHMIREQELIQSLLSFNYDDDRFQLRDLPKFRDLDVYTDAYIDYGVGIGAFSDTETVDKENKSGNGEPEEPIEESTPMLIDEDDLEPLSDDPYTEEGFTNRNLLPTLPFPKFGLREFSLAEFPPSPQAPMGVDEFEKDLVRFPPHVQDYLRHHIGRQHQIIDKIITENIFLHKVCKSQVLAIGNLRQNKNKTSVKPSEEATIVGSADIDMTLPNKVERLEKQIAAKEKKAAKSVATATNAPPVASPSTVSGVNELDSGIGDLSIDDGS
ncbi:hypothetical protein CJU90_4137 [Yarrowia sp. C11]|nr:hypothetical protein CKK34_6753 [Yarrowia sp. E02]KAG5365077.1 hypothetical protein CJU90_4137 [Yarrowia sp. C11]